MKRKCNKIFALIFAFTLASLLLLIASSCSAFSARKSEEVGSLEAELAADSAPVVMRASRMEKSQAAAAPEASNFSYSDFDSAEKNGLPAAAEEGGKKIIKTGDISLEVQSLLEAEKAAEKWAGKFGGYIESSYSGGSEGNVTARIPSSNFDSAMSEIGNLGEVKSRSVSSEDVSERFYDLETRLGSKKVMRARLQEYLSKARDMKDMIEIERELNSVVSDIERMEGSMRRLSSQVEYSSVSVRFSLPYRADPEGKSFMLPDFSDSMRRFAAGAADFFAVFVKIVLYIAVCGTPVVALALFLFWLLVGKCGILRRIFRKLR